ncbi:hypothetical protein ACFQ2T_05000 [Methylophilus flavus]|uniref:Uncharacterized protein n=1 Tax=Methylophilus flavus TaxID=640084 RepID=A0ABW3PD17_9PROT
MNRLDILKASLVNKQAQFDAKLQAHMDCVKQAKGQPLNDKRNGQATLSKWDRQNDALRTLNDSIEKTKAAIEKEESKTALIELTEIPEQIKALIDAGTITQWRKHPTYFFVNGVDKARIVLMKNGGIAHKFLSSIPSQEQYAIFRDVFNGLRKELAQAA